jgi:hypothetical protein
MGAGGFGACFGLCPIFNKGLCSFCKTELPFDVVYGGANLSPNHLSKQRF